MKRKKYLLRLDDASEYINIGNWNRIEDIIDSYTIKPLVGIIPDNQDPKLIGISKKDNNFLERISIWNRKGWSFALHGTNHILSECIGGMNPVNSRTEFVGKDLNCQRELIKRGFTKISEYGIQPTVFFAPAHTFDENTIKALFLETNIRIISDTIANDVYKQDEFYFLPQQTGKARKLPFKFVTLCYHPNTMKEKDFKILDKFLKYNSRKCIDLNAYELTDRKRTFYDRFLSFLYFSIRKVRLIIVRNRLL